jgi:hypothetical protein
VDRITGVNEPAGAAGFIQETQTASDRPSGQLEREAALRWLARTQKLDGSWNGDVEWTAAALLAFVRAGYTSRSGIYRQALRRAARFLVENPSSTSARFFRARALAELAEATGDDADRAAAQASRLALPAVSGNLESAALGQAVAAPTAIHGINDLRLAALLQVSLPVPPELFNGNEAELAQVWAATI